MAWLLKFVLGKVSGPALIYVVVGLFATNALTGYLLKAAWRKTATAVLECEIEALRNANDHNSLIAAELQRIQADLAIEKQRRLDDTRAAEKEIANALRVKEVEHEEQLAALEAVTNEIDDEEYFCASERVAFGQLVGMRDAASTYNQTRHRSSAATNPD